MALSHDHSHNHSHGHDHRMGPTPPLPTEASFIMDTNDVRIATFPQNEPGEKIHRLMHHLHEYYLSTRRRTELLIYMLLVLVYFGVSAALLGANMYDQEFIEANYILPFHLAEFWSQFLFAVLEAFILGESKIQPTLFSYSRTVLRSGGQCH